MTDVRRLQSKWMCSLIGLLALSCFPFRSYAQDSSPEALEKLPFRVTECCCALRQCAPTNGRAAPPKRQRTLSGCSRDPWRMLAFLDGFDAGHTGVGISHYRHGLCDLEHRI